MKAEENAILEQAKALVENTHWVQRSYFKYQFRVSEGRSKPLYCLTGMVNHLTNNNNQHAASTSLTGNELRDDVIARIRRAIRQRSLATSIETWNDYTGRTKEDVIELLDRVLEQ